VSAVDCILFNSETHSDLLFKELLLLLIIELIDRLYISLMLTVVSCVIVLLQCSSSLGGEHKSPSALFVASDGISLRVYQAVLDARSLLTASASKQYQVPTAALVCEQCSNVVLQ